MSPSKSGLHPNNITADYLCWRQLFKSSGKKPHNHRKLVKQDMPKETKTQITSMEQKKQIVSTSGIIIELGGHIVWIDCTITCRSRILQLELKTSAGLVIMAGRREKNTKNVTIILVRRRKSIAAKSKDARRNKTIVNERFGKPVLRLCELKTSY